ncbi:MAG: hypothetical protein MJ165_03550 [Alphaproteobacteria bacterium]|nr:hypothetical protein [Alphaproteobacteria bacterium]
MIGERENITSDTEYGTLVMRSYVIEGNEINAFYDASDDLIFVLDNTINSYKPNVLLVINPDGDKKWDEILSGEYDVDLEMIRPKQDNKYQKLDIEYSGLSVYENLINAYDAGDGLEEHLNQLNILRDSAARHSAMTRLNIANETITKTNATIVKTKETIVRLQERLKTLKAKLSSQKKEIGRVSTKQSAAKILKTESQIEATNEKIKRAKKRLDSAQKRLETATVDAELASELLNQPAQEIKMPVKTKPVVAEPKVAVTQAEEVEDDEELDDDFTDEDEEITEEQEEEVKPLFDTDPNIVDDDMAFKPISFEDSVEKTETVEDNEPELEDQIKELEAETSTPKLEFDPVPELPSFTSTENVSEEYETTFDTNDKPVLDSIMPVPDEDNNLQNDFKIEEQEHIDSLDQVVNMEPQKTMPAEDLIRPVPPAPQSFNAPTNVAPVRPVGDNQTESSKPTFVYYVLLFILIGLSVFTLWLYQNHMGTDKTPALTENIVAVEKTEQPKVAEPVVEKVEVAPVEEESAFIDEEPEVVPEPKVEEPVAEPEPEPEPEPEEVEEDEEPIIINAVPERVSTSGVVQEEELEEEPAVVEVKEPVVNKPVYGASSKRDDMFVYDGAEEAVEDEGPQIIHQEIVMEEEVTTYPETDEEEYVDEEYAQEDEFFDEEEAAYQAEMAEYEE